MLLYDSEPIFKFNEPETGSSHYPLFSDSAMFSYLLNEYALFKYIERLNTHYMKLFKAHVPSSNQPNTYSTY